MIKIIPTSNREELCRIIFGECILWACSGCWKRNKKIVICPENKKMCEYIKPAKDDIHGLPGDCNCEELLSMREGLVTAIQLLGYVK